MKRQSTWGMLAAIAMLALQVPEEAQAAKGFKLIVHPSNPVASLSAKDAAKLFLKKTARWENGEAVLPVDLPPDSDVREAFTQSVHGKSTSALKAWWQRKIFSGEAVPPPERTSEADVVQFVQSTPGAVGYVAQETATPGVKSVSVVP